MLPVGQLESRWYQWVGCVCGVGTYHPYTTSGDSTRVPGCVDFLMYILCTILSGWRAVDWAVIIVFPLIVMFTHGGGKLRSATVVIFKHIFGKCAHCGLKMRTTCKQTLPKVHYWLGSVFLGHMDIIWGVPCSTQTVALTNLSIK